MHISLGKDLSLLDTHEEQVRSRSILGVDSAELVRILELGIGASRFCHITDTKGHGVMSDKALPA